MRSGLKHTHKHTDDNTQDKVGLLLRGINSLFKTGSGNKYL